MKTIEKNYYIVQNVKYTLLNSRIRTFVRLLIPPEMNWMKTPLRYYVALAAFCILIAGIGIAGATYHPIRSAHNTTHVSGHGISMNNLTGTHLMPQHHLQKNQVMNQTTKISKPKWTNTTAAGTLFPGSHPVIQGSLRGNSSARNPERALALHQQKGMNVTGGRMSLWNGNVSPAGSWQNQNQQVHRAGIQHHPVNQSLPVPVP
ncbi:MAG: hypothetical protein WC586_05315 [Methanoregula sp.]